VKASVAIVGGGIAGLTAATVLRRQGIAFTLYESSQKVGGLASSFRDDDGFAYDFGAHFITNRLAAAIGLGAACYDVRRYGESVFTGDRVVSYPLGLATIPRYVASAMVDRVRTVGRQPARIETAAQFFRSRYGTALAREIAEPIIEAWAGESATKLAASVGEGMPGSILRTIALKSLDRLGLSRAATAVGYCSSQPESPYVWHVYPHGGVDAVCATLARGLDREVVLESRVETIYVERERVVGIRVNGRDVETSAVVSSAPLPILSRLIAGSTQLADAAVLRYRAMILVNLRLRGRGLLTDVVLWTPQPRVPFFRLTEAPLAMPSLAPDGKTIVTVDIGAEVGDEHWVLDDETLAARALDHLAQIVPGAKARYLGHRIMRTPVGYPVHLHAYESVRQRFSGGLPIRGLHSIGRNGEFRHILMEDIYWRTIARMRDVARDWHAAEPPLPLFSDGAEAVA